MEKIKDNESLSREKATSYLKEKSQILSVDFSIEILEQKEVAWYVPSNKRA